MKIFEKPDNQILLFFLLICLTLLSIWFKNGYIFGGAEEGLPFYDFAIMEEVISSVWIHLYLGIPYFTENTRLPLFSMLLFFQNAGVPNFVLQLMVFFMIIFGAMFSVYFLLKQTIGEYLKQPIVYLIGALFYLFNPFTLSQVWTRGLYTQYFAFLYFPLFLLLYILSNKKESYLYSGLALIGGFFLSPAMANPSYAVSLWVITISYFIYSLYSSYGNYGKIKFLIVNFLFLVIGWGISNLYWILIYLDMAPKTFLVSGSVFEDSEASLRAVSMSFPLTLVIRLMQSGYFYADNSWYGSIYKTPFFEVISWIIPVVSLFSLFLIRKIKVLIFFGGLFCLGLIVSLGANPPFGELFIWVFNHIPQLQIFRNPYEKFGLVYVLAYAPFFALGVYKLDSYFQKKRLRYLSVMAVFLSLGLFAWPIWTGRVISWGTVTAVPNYYRDLKEWLHENNNQNSRVFFVPFLLDLGAAYNWEKGEYHGNDPMYQIIGGDTLSQTGKNDLLVALRENISKINIAPTLKLLRADFLVVRNDVIARKAEYKQSEYLLDSVYAPQEKEALKINCQNGFEKSINGNAVKIVCTLPSTESDWSGVKYVHLAVKTDQPSTLDIFIDDTEGRRSVWSGKFIKAYRTSARQWKKFDLPLSSLTADLDLNSVKFIEINVTPISSQIGSVAAEITGLSFGSGKRYKVDEFQFAASFDGLQLYRLKDQNYYPEVGLISEVVEVDSFNRLFEKALEDRKEISRKGYLLKEQNAEKDFSGLREVPYTKVKFAEKTGTLKYYLEYERNGAPKFIVLSHAFNVDWKILEGVDKDDLDGSLLNNIKLLGKSYLGEGGHLVINGYANMWKYSGNSGNLAIIFRPQIMMETLYKISSLFIVIIVLVIGYQFVKNVLWKKIN